MASGGQRIGSPGRSYSNRTDLNGNPMRSVAPTPPEPGPAEPGQAVQDPGGQMSALNAAGGYQYALAGQHGSIFRSTEFPNEPVTSGLSSGAGPGPDVNLLSDKDVLNALARRFPTPAVLSLLDQIPLV